jgi:basic membrane protein A
MSDLPVSLDNIAVRKLSRRSFHRVLGGSLALASLQSKGWASASAAKVGPIKVVLLLTGVVTDGGWGQLAFDGLKRLEANPRFKTAYAEDITLAQIQQVARGYSDDGFDLIIGHGFEFSSALLEVAEDYPHQHYFATSFLPEQKVPDNIMFVDIGYFGAAYGAGALAALISERKQAVGFVGGADDPIQGKMKRAFIAGAQRTVPGIRAMGIITGDYDNAAKGREAASTLTGNGADVIWHAADVTGLGAIQGAIAAGAKVLGCYSNQTSLAPASMAASFEINLAGMVTSVAEEVANRTFAGGTEWRPAVDQMWLLKYGPTGDHNPALVSAPAWAAFQKIWADLAARRINVSVLTATS